MAELPILLDNRIAFEVCRREVIGCHEDRGIATS
jgi:hypothetical protein